MGNPIDDPKNDGLPGALNQVAFVQPKVQNTVRLQFDRPQPQHKRWFHTANGMLPVTDGNDVEYLVGGSEAFPAMAEAMDGAVDSSKHFIYFTGWFTHHDCQMFPPGSGKEHIQLQHVLTNAGGRNVEIRAMLWANIIWADELGKAGAQISEAVAKSKSANNPAVAMVNKVGVCIHDARVLVAGSHHQKLLLVNGKDGLIAFTGGIDFNNDRIKGPHPLHDVHLRIRGGAARHLLGTFLRRWEEHPDSKLHPALKGESIAGLGQGTPGKLSVQVARTYPRGPHTNNPEMKLGEQTAFAMVIKALHTARRYVYLEDQYMVSMHVSNAIKKVLSQLEFVLLLVPPKVEMDKETDNMGSWMRKQFIENLRSAPGGDKKVHVFSKQHNFVHSKMAIIDDAFAYVGTANTSLRSHSHDSEIMVGISDPGRSDGAHLNWAHRLRLKVWGKVLSMQTPQAYARLMDPVAAVAWWYQAAPDTVAPFPLPDTTFPGPKGLAKWLLFGDPSGPAISDQHPSLDGIFDK